MNTADTHLLIDLGACREAREWCETQPNLETAWLACPRGDWMLWLAALLGTDRRLLVRAACLCARTALPHVPPMESRPLRAIETAEAWSRDEASLGAVRNAASAASAASADAAAYAAAYAADAAYAAAYAAADASAYAAYAAADASAASADAAAYAYAYASAAYDARARHADLVRSLIPTLPKTKGG